MKKLEIIKSLEMGTSPADIIKSLNQRDREIYEFRIQGIPYKEIQIALSASPNQIAFIDKYLIKKQFDISEPAKPDTFTSDAETESIEPAIKSDSEQESIVPAIKSDSEQESIEPGIKSDPEQESIESANKSDTINPNMKPDTIKPAINFTSTEPAIKPASTEPAIIRDTMKSAMKQEPKLPASIIQNKEYPVTPPETIVAGRDSDPYGFMARRRNRIRK